MKVLFFEPPPQNRIGGLNAAIRGLEQALAGVGIKVQSDLPEENDGEVVAHFHGLWEPRFPALARELRNRKIPYVVSPHGMLEPWAWSHKWWKKWPYYYAIERPWLRRAGCLLATGSGEAHRLHEFFPKGRVDFLPLGLTGTVGPDYENARTGLGWAPEDTVLLFLSRLHEKKGLDLLLLALSELKPPTGTKLVIVGDGEPSYVEEIRGLAGELSKHLPKVEFTGGVWGDQRWRYFQGADLFCLPSHSENFGLAVLEACQAGTPVLTTDTTPWGDLLPREHAFIVQPNKDSVREGLRRFFELGQRQSAQRASLADWTASRFEWGRLVPGYEALYRSLIISVA